MTHTKAPWRIGDAGNTVFGPPCGLPPQRVADLSGTKNMHANGHLIAAAPEMLDALEDCIIALKLWEQSQINDYGAADFAQVIKPLAKARDIVAKATGKEEK